MSDARAEVRLADCQGEGDECYVHGDACRSPWHRVPVNSDVTFCGLPITDDLHLASRPSTATCPWCIEAEKA